MIEKHGGKNVGSISSKTSFILAGENMGPSKLEKAQKLGIQIMNEEDFLQLVGKTNYSPWANGNGNGSWFMVHGSLTANH